MGSLFQDLKKRKVFTIAAVYAVVAWLTTQIVDVINDPLNLPDWFQTVTIVLFAIGFPIALILAWAYEITPEGIKPDSAVQATQTVVQSTDRKLIYAILGLVLLAVGFQIADGFRNTSAPAASGTANTNNTQVIRSSLALGEMSQMQNGLRTSFSLSPDGSRLVYFARGGPTWKIYIRELDQLEGRVIAELPYNIAEPQPTFSPDGELIIYYTDGELHKLSILGGTPQSLVDDGAFVLGGAGLDWVDEHSILFAGIDGQLKQVADSGGVAQSLDLTRSEGGEIHIFPFVLPGGAKMLASSMRIEALSDIESVNTELIDLASGVHQPLLQSASMARYTDSGHIVFLRSSELWAVPFDVETLQISGEQIQLMPGTEVARYSFSKKGRLAYLPGWLVGGRHSS